MKGDKMYQILNRKESKKALRLCDNADCATAGAIDLPDGNPNAERVRVASNRKTGQLVYSICCPWLLADIFHA